MAVTVSASSFSHFWASTREWPTVEQRRGRERQYWPGGQKQRYGASPGSQRTKTGHLGEAAGTAQSSRWQRHLGWGRDWRGRGGSMRGTGKGPSRPEPAARCCLGSGPSEWPRSWWGLVGAQGRPTYTTVSATWVIPRPSAAQATHCGFQ